MSKSETPVAVFPRELIKGISRKADGTYVVEYRGYPFHATAADTPDVFKQIELMIAEGEPWTHYVAPLPSIGEREAAERHWRDGVIERLRWLRERHLDEHALTINTTLSDARFEELLAVLNELRNWPQSEHFPETPRRPVLPDWLDSHLI